MSWGLAFRIRQYVKGSVWLPPAIGVIVGWALAILSVSVDSVLGSGPWTYTAATATSLLSAIVGAMVALAGFVVTVVTLGVQMATGTFSPRYMRLWYRDAMLKGLLAWLIGTLSFAFMAIRFVEAESVPNLTVTLAGLSVTIGLLFFVIYLDRFLHRLRPVAVAAYVADEGRRAFASWNRFTHGPDALLHAAGDGLPAASPALTVLSGSAGAIQAVDTRGLLAFARQHHCLIVFHHALGDFVPRGATLCSIYGPSVPPLAEERLRAMVALGVERTIEQDVAFALRIMVDVATRALSPAVNDPSTAVQVVDHLAETMRMLGTELPVRHVSAELPAEGVMMPLIGWEELLELGITEIREFGATSVQVMRRLRAVLLELDELVPAERRPAVIRQLDRLDATIERTYGSTEDLDLAALPDAQGIGGPAYPRRLPAPEQSTPGRTSVREGIDV